MESLIAHKLIDTNLNVGSTIVVDLNTRSSVLSILNKPIAKSQ